MKESKGCALLKRDIFILVTQCCIVIFTQLEEIPGDQQDYRPQEN